MISLLLCPPVDVNGVFPLFFLPLCSPHLFFYFLYCFFFLLFLSVLFPLSPATLQTSTSTSLSRHPITVLRDLTSPHRTCLPLSPHYMGFSVYLFVFFFSYFPAFLCVRLLTSLCRSVWFFCVASFYGRTLIILTFSTSNRSS